MTRLISCVSRLKGWMKKSKRKQLKIFKDIYKTVIKL